MDLTDEHMELLRRIDGGTRLPLADRKQDRIRQQLRQAGMIKVEMNPRRWVMTSFGLSVLARIRELKAA